VSYWPLDRLRVVAGPVELRIPTRDELDVIAGLAAKEPYTPSVPMFANRADSPVERARRTLQFHWAGWGTWTPELWSLSLAAFRDGEVVGTQNLRAQDFSSSGQVETGSWVRRDRQGEGLGTWLRAGILTLAFDGLGARFALSRSAPGNHAPHAVSRKFGYRDDGVESVSVEDDVVQLNRLLLSAEQWRRHRRAPEVRLEGVEDCLPMFGSPVG
jgi:RimJ/RimL family protein N-acetyltransferase